MAPIHADRWLDHLERHLPLAREGTDPEGVHQVRVALARLDLWLRMGGWRVLRPDLRWLRRGAARVRDLDVQLQRPDLPGAVRSWLDQERSRARVEFLSLLESPRTAGLRLALRALPPLPRARAERCRARLRRKAEARCRRLLDDPEDIERYHDLRRAVRRLRYAIEWLGEDASEVKRVQGVLGELNDEAVLVSLLGSVASGNGIAALRRAGEARLEELRERALRRIRRSEFAVSKP